LENSADPAQDRLVAALAAAGHSVLRIPVKDLYDLGQEMFRWQVAAAVAGSILGVNPFDPPAAKLGAAVSLPAETLWSIEDGIKVYAPAAGLNMVECLHNHLNKLKPGGYFGLVAFIERNLQNEVTLQAIRTRVLKAKKVATGLSFGPGLFPSKGQTGVFLQITSGVPDQEDALNAAEADQARAHQNCLAECAHQVLHIDLGLNVRGGLTALASAVDAAIQ
jgi:hypothetical protein